MEKIVKINSAQEMIDFGFKVGQLAYPNMVIALDGDLGAGKTTFTKGIAKALNITKIVNSPTFVIMKIYEGDLTLYHLDVYRTSSSEFELSEYFELGGVSVIEWAEQIKELLPNDAIFMYIKDTGNDTRDVSIKSSNLKFLEGLEK